MKIITVNLAGKEYELRALPIRQAREFRKKFTKPVEEMINVLGSASKTELSDVESMKGVVDAVKTILLGSIDLLVDLLFEYSAELNADRDTIEAQATDEEALAAFAEVFKLLYPFGSLAGKIPGLKV